MTEKTEATAHEEGPNVKPIPAAAIAALLNSLASSASKGIHEVGVNGSVIEQTHNFLAEHMKVDFVDITREDGVDVPAYLDHDGVHIIPPSAFDAWATKPRFRKGTARLTDLSSFTEHVNRYKDKHSVVFANDDRTAPSFNAVLNYHEEGAEGEPRFGDHRTHLAFRLSDEWVTWQAYNNKPILMADFARFLEDQIVDVLPTGMFDASNDEGAQRFISALGGNGRIADPAQLMSLATNLHINEQSVVSQASVLSSGEVKLDFQTTHEASQGGQSITVPTMFVIGIPVFKNGEAYPMIARLRYRKTGSELRFWYELWRSDRVFDKAFDESIQRVQTETGLTVLMGADEGC